MSFTTCSAAFLGLSICPHLRSFVTPTRPEQSLNHNFKSETKVLAGEQVTFGTGRVRPNGSAAKLMHGSLQTAKAKFVFEACALAASEAEIAADRIFGVARCTS